MIIGITGNSGSGKTLLSKLIKSKYSSDVIDADKIVQRLSMPGNIYYSKIVKEFGKSIVLENGEINKTKLADIVFNDNKKREALNNLTFKYVVEESKKEIETSKNKVIIVDAPLLIESGLNNICDVVISILANEDTKIKRICTRDNLNKDSAKTRLDAQQDDVFYIMNSNIVIVNNEGNKLEEQIDSIIELIESDMINSKEIVLIQDNNLRVLQFKKLLEYKDKVAHLFTLKPLNFGSNDTYESIKKEVNDNYNLVCGFLELDSKNIVRAVQTHTNNIKEINDEIGILRNDFKDIDGLVTNKKNRVLSLVYADCTPVYIYDKNKNIIGNIHSGWQGTVKKISKEAIKYIKERFGSDPKDIICIIGPTIRKCHFEVKKDVRDLFYNTFSYMNNIDDIINYRSNTDSYFIDTVEINKNLLLEEGIPKDNIIDSNICTVNNSNILHSYRKDGKNSGRCTSIISLI